MRMGSPGLRSHWTGGVEYFVGGVVGVGVWPNAAEQSRWPVEKKARRERMIPEVLLTRRVPHIISVSLFWPQKLMECPLGSTNLSVD